MHTDSTLARERTTNLLANLADVAVGVELFAQSVMSSSSLKADCISTGAAKSAS